MQQSTILATIVYDTRSVPVVYKHSLRRLTRLTQWIESSHWQSKLIGLLFSNHLNNRH